MDAANPDESLRTPELLLVEMFPPAPSKIVVTEEEMVELEIIPPPQPDELPGWVWAVMLKKNLANKIFGYEARCDFWSKLELRFWILVG